MESVDDVVDVTLTSPETKWLNRKPRGMSWIKPGIEGAVCDAGVGTRRQVVTGDGAYGS